MLVACFSDPGLRIIQCCYGSSSQRCLSTVVWVMQKYRHQLLPMKNISIISINKALSVKLYSKHIEIWASQSYINTFSAVWIPSNYSGAGWF